MSSQAGAASDPPFAPEVLPGGIPTCLRGIDCWIGWRWYHNGKKWTKVPINARTGNKALSTESRTWSSWEVAYSACRSGSLTGVGFVFSDSNDLVGIDLDDCRDPTSGDIEPWAQKIVELLDSWTEVSPSGTGLHIIVRGKLPPDGRRRGAIEVYESERFFTVTGNHLPHTPTDVQERPTALAQFHAEYIAVEKQREISGLTPTEDQPATDYRVLTAAFNAANGSRVRQLYDGDISLYDDDHSRADMAFCSHLVFYTQSVEQIDRIFRGSGLMRAKWDEYRGVDTYGELTIREALQGVEENYTWPQVWVDVEDDNGGKSINLAEFMRLGSKLKN